MMIGTGIAICEDRNWDSDFDLQNVITQKKNGKNGKKIGKKLKKTENWSCKKQIRSVKKQSRRTNRTWNCFKHTKQRRCVIFVLFYYQAVEVQNTWIAHFTVLRCRYQYKVMVNRGITSIPNNQIILTRIEWLQISDWRRRNERSLGYLYYTWIAVQCVLQIYIEVNKLIMCKQSNGKKQAVDLAEYEKCEFYTRIRK